MWKVKRGCKFPPKLRFARGLGPSRSAHSQLSAALPHQPSRPETKFRPSLPRKTPWSRCQTPLPVARAPVSLGPNAGARQGGRCCLPVPLINEIPPQSHAGPGRKQPRFHEPYREQPWVVGLEGLIGAGKNRVVRRHAEGLVVSPKATTGAGRPPGRRQTGGQGNRCPDRFRWGVLLVSPGTIHGFAGVR